MALIRWEPVTELNTIQNEMNRLFNTFFDQPAPTGRGGAPARRWIPAMDLVETADHYVLRADLPGLSDDDVNVQLEDNVLTISGERKTQHEQQRGGLLPNRARVRQLRPLANPPRRRRPRRGASPLRPRRARDPNPQARTEKAPTGPDQPRHPPNRRHQDDREHRHRRPAGQQPRPGPSARLIHELPYRPSRIADRGQSPPRSAIPALPRRSATLRDGRIARTLLTGDPRWFADRRARSQHGPNK